MDAEYQAWLEGTLTAQSFIMQNLYATILAQTDDPSAECKAIADEMLRQFRLPVTNRGPIDADRKNAAITHGEASLRRFWELVQGRLDQAGL
ncbi:hypothetical protein [Sphingomonas carotinifaciens]|uniref:hypothetical protein n=1 Tax=Sphingomonas carotinifaciens TaxID=1166323 RepID=UPI000DDB6D8C|nr:hypothetical protein [Sphingomonas carotinifaciens]